MASPINVKPGVFSGTFAPSSAGALEKVLGSELDDAALERMSPDTKQYIYTVASNVSKIAEGHIKIVNAQTKQFSNLNSDEDEIENFAENANEVVERFTTIKDLADNKAHQTNPGLGLGGFKTGTGVGFVAGAFANPYIRHGVTAASAYLVPKVAAWAFSLLGVISDAPTCPPGFSASWINGTNHSIGFNCTR